MIGNISIQRWWHPQRLVTANEIVVHEVQGDSVAMVFKLLAEGVRQPVNLLIRILIVRFCLSM